MPSAPFPPPGTMPALPDMLRVLVLDDQRFDRHKLCRLCSGLPIKCEVTQAESLSSFDLQLDQSAFDLIFLDYSLPDGTGIDALEKIHLSPRNCNATSIMVTSYDEETISFEAMARGCADYVTKDELSPASFERAVTNAMQKSMLGAQVESQTYAREEVEKVLNRFANQCVSDIKPMVSRMIRQLRSLRDTPNSDKSKSNEHRASVEASCLHLWQFLEELEQQHADVMMRDLIGQSPQRQGTSDENGLPSNQDTADALLTYAQKRPPSPFSRPPYLG